MISVQETNLPGILEINTDTFEDLRGQNFELYREREYTEKGITVKFLQDSASFSRRNVLRGIHGDEHTWKLVSCVHGKIYLVVVDCTTSEWQSFEISDENRTQILISPGYGNAHLVLSDYALFHYKLSHYYDRKTQFTYRWDSPRFNIRWPITDNLILANRDKEGIYLE